MKKKNRDLRGSRETLQATPAMVSARLTKEEEDQRTQKKEENTKRSCGNN